MVTLIIEPRLESLPVWGGCCTDDPDIGMNHFHIYADDVHVASVPARG